MKNEIYKIKRENIFVGEVIKVDGFRKERPKDKEMNLSVGSKSIDGFESYRSILYTVDESSRASDLLYNSPDYPIVGVSSLEDCMNNSSKIFIRGHINLDTLLRYFNYSDTLTYKDVRKVRKAFFGPNWIYKNAEVFGMEEFERQSLYDEGGLCEENCNIERDFFINGGLFGKSLFLRTREGDIPFEIGKSIECTRDNNFKEALLDALFGLGFHIDSFKPNKNEGNVKKLSFIPKK